MAGPINRNEIYTREEICIRHGYDLVINNSIAKKNRNRFFKRNYLDRGLKAIPVGNTFEVNGEDYFAWSLAVSRICQDVDD